MKKIQSLLAALFFATLIVKAQAVGSLSNPSASKEAVALFSYLNAMSGKKILSGQMWAPWGYDELKYINAVTGKQPAIRGIDFIDSRENDAEVQHAIDWWKSGGIPTIMWHWGAPTKGEGYINSKETVNIDSIFVENSPQHKAFWMELKSKADLLEKIRDAHVPVLWRPFHELNGNWFWWSKQGPEKFKKLWITVYDYLVHTRKLNNLIWILCYTDKPDAAWYPGNNYVDIAGADIYSPSISPQLKMFSQLKPIVGNNRPLAFHECGIPPNPDSCLSSGAMWSWWMEWHTGHLKKVDSGYLKYVYHHDLIITLDEVPDIVKEYGEVSRSAQASPTHASNIQLNQVGFYPLSKKIAIITGENVSTKFFITSDNTVDTFFTGTLSEERKSSYSSTTTRIADFSALSKQGIYRLIIGDNKSFSFEIASHVLKKAGTAVLKGYYFQRASMPLEEKFAGKWKRSGFHPDDSVFIHPSAASGERPEGTIVASPGGWYDAGDYNKYIVNSGITMGTILSAYEDFPEYFRVLNTTIPESSDAIPDILNEAIYNLRWMLTMQDPEDGGVYNKCTNANFDGMVMPGITKAKRYLVQKGTAATLDFVAVTAQAARILRSFNKQLPGLADSCIKASKAAWNWAKLHPDLEYNQTLINRKFLPQILTGGYGDKNFSDEWLWAAAEIFLTTKDTSYYGTIIVHLKDNINLPTWSNVGMLGFYSCLRFGKKSPQVLAGTLTTMKNKLINIANAYIDRTTLNAFQTVMGQSEKDFGWGSNSTAANQGVLLINAYLLTNDKKYFDFAISNVDYILGRNATGYCFVTGLGSKSPMFPHHRQSTADGIADPIPGLLAGGPNPDMQDHCHYDFTEAETAYTDVSCSYASNEIAINWNAPVVYLFNAIEALQVRAGYSKK